MGSFRHRLTAGLPALHLFPDEAEVRRWGEEARALLVELRARPYLERLDAMLATAPAPADHAATAPAESAVSRD